ncbi:hypothetical protein [Prosthecomicrobium pneumaticum]|uniref:FkbM family methyltransferase n=1 Tax=Prosthecomicrobium pneumaticum TaxID=81895 RepID=A0A7W9FL06_9HYPH|nr:hypothetical protein [Prosthecomicrobium pneumaticum]MBB5751874.1 FkbM family methyltransferase [Prosthecomicrobium pneumaticum]
MIPLKAHLRDLLRASMRGERDGLSPFGRFAKRLAHHVEFHARVLEREARFSAPAAEPSNGWGEEDIRGRLVYDFGANHGRNIPYYLARGLNVVAVEANPLLCSVISDKYIDYCKEDRLKVINACIVPDESVHQVEFYIHSEQDSLSTFVVPGSERAADFRMITLPSLTPGALFDQYGDPFYVKIDLEGLDGPIVRSMTRSVSVPYVSAEIHTPDVFLELASAGYTKFKIVEGEYVNNRYFDIDLLDFKWKFEYDAAGPFGEDVPGRWLSASEMALYLAANGYGWKDIHAKL